MLDKRYASPEQLAQARETQRVGAGDLARILIEMGLNPRDVYEAKAQEMQVPFVDLTVFKPDQSAIDAVPYYLANKHNILPIKKDGATLYVAMSDLYNTAANEELRLASGCRVRGVLAVPEHIAQSIAHLYGPSRVAASSAEEPASEPEAADTDEMKK